MNTLRLLAYVGPTVLLVVYSQLIMKWRMTALGPLPPGDMDKALFLLKTLFDPYIASAFVAALAGGIIWLAAMSRIPLNVGFPAYYGLTFVFIVLGSVWLLGEPMTNYRLVGAGLVFLGVVVGSMD